MAIASPHRHLGFAVHMDELTPEGVIVMRSSTWAALHEYTAQSASTFNGSVEDARKDTSLNATVVGPVSGPDAGTGPLVPVHTAVTKEILPANPLDTKPNALSPEQAAAQDDKATTVETDQNLAPYPVGDVPAVPTTVDPEYPDTAPELEPVPLPEHPAIENEPPAAETPEHAYLREEEAKGEQS